MAALALIIVFGNAFFSLQFATFLIKQARRDQTVPKKTLTTETLLLGANAKFNHCSAHLNYVEDLEARCTAAPQLRAQEEERIAAYFQGTLSTLNACN
uniref:Uncharacterized protein n=1 Tax=Panstrongylus lignarius TaxID=156445 RepID=A0A224XR00_9HEMI